MRNTMLASLEADFSPFDQQVDQLAPRVPIDLCHLVVDRPGKALQPPDDRRRRRVRSRLVPHGLELRLPSLDRRKSAMRGSDSVPSISRSMPRRGLASCASAAARSGSSALRSGAPSEFVALCRCRGTWRRRSWLSLNAKGRPRSGEKACPTPPGPSAAIIRSPHHAHPGLRGVHPGRSSPRCSRSVVPA